jgi:IS605 OrfB family transposase
VGIGSKEDVGIHQLITLREKNMGKVTRIAYSKRLNDGKYNRLVEIARRLGILRSEVWNEFGSINGARVKDREVRDMWMADNKHFDVPARLWKETLRDVMDDIKMYSEAAKVKVRKSIQLHTDDNEERKRLYTLLKYDKWADDPYLRRMMRKYFKHGHSDVRNQIILDTDCYNTFNRNNKVWVAVMSLERGNRIAIPLNTNIHPSGTLRLILRNGKVEIHYAIDEESVCSTKPCGNKTIGVDKGYTEVFVDSDGDRHGEGLGELLSKESDYLKLKYQRRNKLKALANNHKNKNKSANIKVNNLGRKKLNKRRELHKMNVRDKVFKATHTVIDKANNIAVEDLRSPIKDKQKYGKDQSRRLSGWVKGTIADSIETVSRRRGSSVQLVNASYTSQVDSTTGLLLGKRVGDRFYRANGDVVDADINGARNVLARLYDSEIQLYTPYRKVKEILVSRTERIQRLGLLNQDTSCNGPTNPLSTVSEVPCG